MFCHLIILLQIPSKISLLKLKDIELSKLNKVSCAYVDLISDYEAITIVIYLYSICLLKINLIYFV